MEKIKELKKIIKEAYDKHFAEPDCDGHCKMVEGNITISYDYGHYFDEDYLTKKPDINLEIYSYIFSDEGRRKDWTGKDLDKLLDKAIRFFNQFINKEDAN